MAQGNRYNANDVTILVNGQPIDGFADGDMVSWAETDARSTTLVDAKGKANIATTNQQTGTITFNLTSASVANKQFAALLNSNSSFSISVSYLTERVSSQTAVFDRAPAGSFGKTFPTRTWVANCPDYQYEFD